MSSLSVVIPNSNDKGNILFSFSATGVLGSISFRVLFAKGSNTPVNSQSTVVISQEGPTSRTYQIQVSSELGQTWIKRTDIEDEQPLFASSEGGFEETTLVSVFQLSGDDGAPITFTELCSFSTCSNWTPNPPNNTTLWIIVTCVIFIPLILISGSILIGRLIDKQNKKKKEKKYNLVFV